MTASGIDTVIFDLDGTLYEDVRVYDRFAEELAGFLPPEKRSVYLEAWERAKVGESVARVGMGYDTLRDVLFRFDGREVTTYAGWDGRELPPQSPPLPAETGPPVDTPALGPGRLIIGDWWYLPDVLAAHYGIPADRRSVAFNEVRTFMASDAFRLRPEPGVTELLSELRGRGKRLLAMSNSPADSVSAVLGELDLLERFDLVITDSQKPAGMRRYIEGTDHPDRILSVGDVYVNEIQPVLEAGGAAVYIDRHGTGFGAEHARCVRVASISEAISWLHANL